MPESDEFTPAAIRQLSWQISDGNADPEDAKALLRLFCELERKGAQPSPDLNRHLSDAFEAFLKGEKGLEAALGIVRRRGAPNADEYDRTMLAVEILRDRLSGVSHQEALENVSERSNPHRGKTIVGEAWAPHKMFALIVLRIERSERGEPWTPDEVSRLTEIFGGEPWFTPGNSGNNPA